ncbi:MAG: hypothetical protein FWG68_06835 [Defluviitaleaceae bacterium]|nr:hypothetical protein [Defluviitaleaceae bacterium]
MEFLLYVGIGMTATAVIGGIVAAIGLKIYGGVLNRKLDAEYGKQGR